MGEKATVLHGFRDGVVNGFVGGKVGGMQSRSRGVWLGWDAECGQGACAKGDGGWLGIQVPL